MRKPLLAALLGTLILAACTEEPSRAPTEPEARFDKGVPCPTTPFPLQTANQQVTALYPAGPRRTAALAKVFDISKRWSQCKVADPQGKVVAYVSALLADFRASRLIGGLSTATANLVSDHIDTMFSGVGFLPLNLVLDPSTGTEFGTGFFIPGTPLTVRTNTNNAAVFLGANSFAQPTAITLLLRPPGTNPFDGTGRVVFPPFYEITASNMSNIHYLSNGATAVVAFCVDDEVTPINELTDPAIAHIAVAEGTNPGGFEVLPEATEGQYNALNIACSRFSPSEASLFGGGFKGFATAAPKYLRTVVADLLLPTELEAAAAVGKTGLGGLARSLSPFGVTDRVAGSLSLSRLDPEFASEESGTSVTRRVQVLNGENSVPNVPVTFSTTTGTLNGNTTQVVTSDADGQAAVSWLLPATPAVFTLTASIPGIPSVTYTVAGASDGLLSPLPCSLEGTIKSLTSATEVNVQFANDFGVGGPSVSVFWLNFNGLRQFTSEGPFNTPYRVLPAGDPELSSYTQQTFVTHPWILTTPGEPETCYGIYLPLASGTSSVSVGAPPIP